MEPMGFWVKGASVRKNLAVGFGFLLPAAINYGPPLPMTFKVQWPMVISSRLPGIVSKVGNIYSRGKSSLITSLAGK